MLDFNYINKTEIIFGKGKSELIGETIKRYGYSNVLVVYGGYSAIKNGLIDLIKNKFVENGINYTLLGGVTANPLSDFVYEGIETVHQNSCDLVLAVGGGSVIDASKAIAAGAVYDGDFWDFFRKENRVKIEKTMPTAVMLTMSAAGSENSESIVITNSDTNEKRGNIRTHVVRPVFTIEDPTLSFTVSEYQTACGIVDMMVHILERYFTNTPNCMVVDSMCEGVLKTLLRIGVDAVNNPEDYDLRANLMWASTIAHNNVLGVDREQDWASHKIEHELSSLYGLAHGAGLAVVVPRWMRYVSKRNPSKFIDFAHNVMGVEEIDEAIDKLAKFFKDLGMPTTLEEIGYKDIDLRALVEGVDYIQGDFVGYYVKLRREDVKNIYLGRY